MFIYKLPYPVWAKLVLSLNENDAWKDLAGHRLEYDHLDIQRFREARYKEGNSPADALLTSWGQRNGTVEELFRHLHALGLYQSMVYLKDFVPVEMQQYLHQRPVVRSPEVKGPVASSLNLKSNPPRPRTDQGSKKEIWNNLDHVPEDGSSSAAAKAMDLDFMGNLCEDDNIVNVNQHPWKQTGDGQTVIKRYANEHQNDFDAAPGTVAAAAPAPAVGSPGHQGSASLNQVTSSTRHDVSSRLKERIPSGVPLPGNDIFLKNVSFDVLKMACHNFDKSIPGVLLGHGGFGEVFKGRLDGQDIAVKRILEEKRFQLESDAYQRCINQAITELQTLQCYPAENILPLLAISFDKDFKTDPCLVYQYMPNGSVSDRLKCRNGTPPLSWDQRANIAMGTARGLVYLHANNIIHGDIKGANILLDRHFEPKIGDFGLARGGPENAEETFKLISTVKGTEAYLPLDFIRSHQLAPSVDTFSYGIVMFELVTAKSPSYRIPDHPDQFRMRDVMMDSTTPYPWVDRSVPFSHWIYLLYCCGRDCAQQLRQRRPSMKEVLEVFDRIFHQPTPALALQSYYDQQLSVNNAPPATSGATALPDPAPEASVAMVISSGRVHGQLLLDLENPSLPNLSKFLTSSPCAEPTSPSDDSLPDLSLLNEAKRPLPSPTPNLPDFSMISASFKAKTKSEESTTSISENEPNIPNFSLLNAEATTSKVVQPQRDVPELPTILKNHTDTNDDDEISDLLSEIDAAAKLAATMNL